MINRLGFADVAAICSSNEEEGKKVQKQYGIPFCYKDYDQLLFSTERIDVIHNCTPNHLHYEINKKIILAKKHVFSEKPLYNHEQSKELCKLVSEINIAHGVNAFLTGTETNNRSYATFEDGHRMMCLIDAMIKSNEEGKWMKVIHY